MNKLLLEQTITEYRIKHIINTPHLKAKYLAEYKRETGSNALDEGLKDWLKDKFSSAKTAVKSAATKVSDTAKSAATKVSNVAKGIADIGFLGRGTTIFNGAETFDIKKRESMIGEAEKTLDNELTELTNIFKKYVKNENLNYGTKLSELNKLLIDKGFPNSKSFEGDVRLIKNMYFEITENYKHKQIKDKLANLAIAVLRHLVIFYQDYKVYDKNLYLNEEQRKQLKILLREQADVEQNNEEEQDYSKVKGRKQGDVSASYKAAYSAKLPTALIIGGASLVALGIGADSDIFQNLLERFKDMGEATEGIAGEVSKVIIGKGQGITQVLGNMTGVDLGPNVKVSSLNSAAIKALAPAMRAAVVAKNGEAGGQAFDQVMNLAGTNNNQTLGQVLQGKLSGTGKSVSDLLDVDAGSFTKIIKDKVDAVAAKPLDTLKNTLLKWMGKFAGPVLTGLGFAVAAGGVASAALRTKGKLSSRMSTLKNLVDTFKDVGSQEGEGEGEGEPPEPPPTPGPTPGPTPPTEGEEGEGGGEPPEPPTEEDETRTRTGPEVVIDRNKSIDQMALDLLGVGDKYERNKKTNKIGPNPNGDEKERELNREFSSLKKKLGKLINNIIKSEITKDTKNLSAIQEKILREYSPDNKQPVSQEHHNIYQIILQALNVKDPPDKNGNEEERQRYRQIFQAAVRVQKLLIKKLKADPEFKNLKIISLHENKKTLSESTIKRWKKLAGIIKG